jgi:hypothetical protein
MQLTQQQDAEFKYIRGAGRGDIVRCVSPT